MGNENWREMNAEDFGKWSVGKMFIDNEDGTFYMVTFSTDGRIFGTVRPLVEARAFMSTKLLQEDCDVFELPELANLREENRILREGLGKYADNSEWGESQMWFFDFWMGSSNGFDLATETLAAADAVGKGEK